MMSNMFSKVISASLSPNSRADDVFAAFKLLFTPWKWIQGPGARRVEDWFGKNFTNYRALSFNSGRSALFGILRAFDIRAGDEVLLQAFTCVAVPNSVLWAGAKPVYVDIDETLNIDVLDAQKKITKKTRAVIIQHTLGIPAQVDTILTFAKKNNLIIIEDCAHGLGGTFDGKKLGSFGDASFFSFGRDKVLSSVFGGMALIQKRYEKEWITLKNFHKQMLFPRGFWIFQQLLHPVLFAFILPFYRIGIGKVILFLSLRVKLLSPPVYPEEKMGKKPNDFPAKYPNALAQLLVQQLKKLETYNSNRKTRAGYYREQLKDNKKIELFSYPKGSIYLRFPLLVSDPSAVSIRAKKAGILLGNWYHNVIDPTGVDFDKIRYTPGSCRRAEYVAKYIVNLPTNITQKESRRVLDLFS